MTPITPRTPKAPITPMAPMIPVAPFMWTAYLMRMGAWMSWRMLAPVTEAIEAITRRAEPEDTPVRGRLGA